MYDKDTNEVKINTLKVNHFKYKFESIDEVYKNGMSIRDAYLRAGNDLSVAQQWEQVISDYTFNMNGTASFETLYLEYLAEKERARNWGGITDRTREIESRNDLVALAYRYLTPEKVGALRYNSTDVRNAVHFELPDTQTALKSALREHFIEGGTYTNEDAKSLYQDTLNRLEIKKKAKVSELRGRYLNTNNTKLPVDGERKNGFKILGFINLIFGIDKHKEHKKPNIIKRAIKKIMSIFSVK